VLRQRSEPSTVDLVERDCCTVRSHLVCGAEGRFWSVRGLWLWAEASRL